MIHPRKFTVWLVQLISDHFWAGKLNSGKIACHDVQLVLQRFCPQKSSVLLVTKEGKSTNYGQWKWMVTSWTLNVSEFNISQVDRRDISLCQPLATNTRFLEDAVRGCVSQEKVAQWSLLYSNEVELRRIIACGQPRMSKMPIRAHPETVKS